MTKRLHLGLAGPLLLGLVSAARSQAVPAVTRAGGYLGFQLPTVQGALQYSVSASEILTFGFDGAANNAHASSVSGNIAFLSSGNQHPLSVLYSGAYLFAASNEPSTFVQSLTASQVYKWEKWSAVASDSVSYSPEAPSVGLSGIPGLGDQNLFPVIGTGPSSQGLLSGYAPRITNSASASLSRNVTGSTTVQGTGSYSILRFVGVDASQGIDDNQLTLGGGLNHRINALNNIGGQASYSKYTFSGTSTSVTTETALLTLNRQLSRKVSLTLGVGPQRTASSDTALFPPTTGISVDGSLTYAAKTYNGFLSYFRGTSGGAGVVTGALSNNITAGATRRFTRNVQGTASVSYYTTQALFPGNAGLPVTTALFPTSNIDSLIVSAQANYRLSPTLTAYASYAALHQLTQGLAVSGIALNGLSQTLAFGITFSPIGPRFGHND